MIGITKAWCSPIVLSQAYFLIVKKERMHGTRYEKEDKEIIYRTTNEALYSKNKQNSCVRHSKVVSFSSS